MPYFMSIYLLSNNCFISLCSLQVPFYSYDNNGFSTFEGLALSFTLIKKIKKKNFVQFLLFTISQRSLVTVFLGHTLKDGFLNWHRANSIGFLSNRRSQTDNNVTRTSAVTLISVPSVLWQK